MIKAKYFFGVFLILILLTACGAEVPKKELATAKKEIQRAEKAQANDLDRENLEEAKTELQAAEKLVKNEKNEEAKKKALNSIVKARLAVKTSKSKLLKNKIDKVKELIVEAKRYHAHKISEKKFKSGVDNYNQAKQIQTQTEKNKTALTQTMLKTGDSVPKYENYITDSDKGISIVTKAQNLLEGALVDSKARIHKLERNLAETSNLLNQLQKDRLIVKNFKDKLDSIRNKLNQANDYYKKFKFTDDTTQALEYLSKAEKLADEAYAEANQLNTEGRAQLQAIYKEKAKKALSEAQNRVKEAEELYKNRVEPAGSRKNPWIPKGYRKLKNKASFKVTRMNGKLLAQTRTDMNPEQETQQPPQQSTPSNPDPNNSGGAVPPSDNREPGYTPGTGNQDTPEQSPEENTRKKAEGASDIDIEKELEQEGKKQENLTIDQMYARMKDKMKSADEKYKKGDYVGSWEDAEEAKMLAAKIKEKTRATSGTAINSGSSYKKLEIWKYYIVKYRRKNTDCLWRIALKLYGDATLWPMIWYANKLKIADPDVIFPRQKLAIPKVDSSHRSK